MAVAFTAKGGFPNVLFASGPNANVWFALLTVIVAVAELFPGTMSVSTADTVAVLLVLPAPVGVTTMATEADSPLTNVPSEQLTVVVPEHEP